MVIELTNYSEEFAKKVCEVISSTPKSLNMLANELDWFPAKSTIYKWKIDHPTFAEMYTQAKRHQAEIFVDELINIAYDSSKDTIIDKDGNKKCNTEWVNRCRLKADTIKWIASKHCPRLYGEKIHAEITGKDDKPIEIETKMAIGLIEERIKDMMSDKNTS